jgi:ATP-binding cassette, subfamily G (WHITE), eye pigment precursor transporter
MNCMKRLAQAGRTVVASIHQPRSAIYAILDDLILISEGRTVYIGPASKAVAHFSAHGFVCPPQYNQSDFFLDTISMDYRTPEATEATRGKITMLADAWAQKGGDLEAGSAPDSAAAGAVVDIPAYRSGWFSNLYYLTWRANAMAYRNKMALGIKLVLSSIFALLFSAIWSDFSYNQTGPWIIIFLPSH